MKKTVLLLLLTITSLPALACEFTPFGRSQAAAFASHTIRGYAVTGMGVSAFKREFYGKYRCAYEVLYSYENNEGEKFLARTIFDALTFERIVPDLHLSSH